MIRFNPTRPFFSSLTCLSCIILMTLGLGFFSSSAQAFCGFYVAKANSQLFNRASTVVVARKDHNTVITMAADYQGEAKDFALVVPVPEILEKGQIHVASKALVEHLDAFTAPRLVEYFDRNPCEPEIAFSQAWMRMDASPEEFNILEDAPLGVTIEAQYQVEEYDILILSAKQSSGLQTWLDANGYQVPAKAQKVLASYIKQGMKFFVAKINLEQQDRLGIQKLRPLQMAFSSKRFMLPIRLGTVNAQQDQEMFVLGLSTKGRIETTNYRTIKIPTDIELPLYTAEVFGDFYKAMFTKAIEQDHGVMLEYAWNIATCDPCASQPLSNSQLRQLGAYWLSQGQTAGTTLGNTFVTRLHLRYNANTFPEDLMLQETGDRSHFQGRYILRHPWQGERKDCSKAAAYLDSLPATFEQQAQNIARLTGWDISAIRDTMAQNGQPFETPEQATLWWQSLWDHPS